MTRPDSYDYMEEHWIRESAPRTEYMPVAIVLMLAVIVGMFVVFSIARDQSWSARFETHFNDFTMRD